MLTPSHQPLVYHLGSIVAARVNMNAFLDHGIGPRAECLSRLVATGLNLGPLARLSLGLRRHLTGP